MSTSISHSLSLNTGLADVLTAQDLEGAQLPQLASFAPSEEAMEAQLPQLQASVFDDRVLSALRPILKNRDILSPSRYQALADQMPAALESAAANAPEGESRDVLLAAAGLLKEEKTLRDLLSLLRHALHKA